ncbi:hypothetical protein OVA07_04095 [Novosphingobium sp. SL115]|uniref:hypothetical protein n=1 Tax=Novosphingobium sp. SL115 TaxID=2995150 RepID=UPI002272D400|nr:hypothetical protein [Novosphingobium sp. SL115]MCY1670189.1 hypothetical protein [Novosphingobium sp. SL115]
MDEPETDAVLDLSAGYAATEMHYGRLEWLAEHIRRSNFHISPMVAKKILEMLENEGDYCRFEIKAVRRSDLSPRSQDPQMRDFRAADMALEVARACKFKRGELKQAYHDVGVRFGLEAAVVARQVRPFKQMALNVLAEEEAQAAYERGEIDFLGRPKSP